MMIKEGGRRPAACTSSGNFSRVPATVRCRGVVARLTGDNLSTSTQITVGTGQTSTVLTGIRASEDGSPVSFHAGFHTYAVEWEEAELRFYVDGNLHFTVAETGETPTQPVASAGRRIFDSQRDAVERHAEDVAAGLRRQGGERFPGRAPLRFGGAPSRRRKQHVPGGLVCFRNGRGIPTTGARPITIIRFTAT